jgi:hypothetical protein
VLGVCYNELNCKMRTWKAGPSCVLLDLTLKGLTTENGHIMAYTSHSTVDSVIYVVKDLVSSTTLERIHIPNESKFHSRYRLLHKVQVALAFSI